MRTDQTLSPTVVGVIALLALWVTALAGIAALPHGSSATGIRVSEPTGLLISRQDMSGHVMLYRELRAVARASGPEPIADSGRC